MTPSCLSLGSRPAYRVRRLGCLVPGTPWVANYQLPLGSHGCGDLQGAGNRADGD
jgi:hypothetical protein